MNDHNITPGNSLNSKGKDTNVYSFLKVVPHLKGLSRQTILKLSERFNINPDSFVFLINITANGVVFYYEN